MASIARNGAIDVMGKRSEVSIEEEPSAMGVAADTRRIRWRAEK